MKYVLSAVLILISCAAYGAEVPKAGLKDKSSLHALGAKSVQHHQGRRPLPGLDVRTGVSAVMPSDDFIPTNVEGERPPLVSTASRVRILVLLLLSGADPNSQDAQGQTMLLKACEFGFAEAADLLLIAGADKTVSDNSCRKPLFVASQFGHVDVVRLLLDSEKK